MNSWHDYMSSIATCRNVYDFMPVSFGFQALVSAPSVSAHLGTHLNIILDKCMETLRRYIRHHRHAYSARPFPSDLSSYRHNCLSFGPAPSDLCPNSTNVRLVNFNRALQLVSSRADHSATQFVQPLPCSIVASEAKNSLQPKGTGPMLLTRDEPHRQKPDTKWFVRFMEQCTSRNRSLVLALPAQIKASFHQRWNFSYYAASGATKTVGPSKLSNILKAIFFAGKPNIKFLERSWVVGPGNRIFLGFHDPILHYVAG